jgi:hypothetical protein
LITRGDLLRRQTFFTTRGLSTAGRAISSGAILRPRTLDTRCLSRYVTAGRLSRRRILRGASVWRCRISRAFRVLPIASFTRLVIPLQRCAFTRVFLRACDRFVTGRSRMMSRLFFARPIGAAQRFVS